MDALLTLHTVMCNNKNGKLQTGVSANDTYTRGTATKNGLDQATVNNVQKSDLISVPDITYNVFGGTLNLAQFNSGLIWLAIFSISPRIGESSNFPQPPVYKFIRR